MTIVSNKPIWHSLQELSAEMQAITMQALFLVDPLRASKLNVEAAGLHLDYSKNRIDSNVMDQLLELAKIQQVPEALSQLSTGEMVNVSEKRPALHTLLRADGKNVAPQLQPEFEAVSAALDQMEAVVSAVNSGDLRGFNGDKITDVINIGIGGSDLGPMMLHQALAPQASSQLNLHFLSTCDRSYVNYKLKQLDPSTTLIVVVSKSFTTQETLINAEIVKAWMMQEFDNFDAIRRQWFAVTASPNKAIDHGFIAEHVLPIWDWVGGRFSVWSCVSLSVAIILGMDVFKQFLAGGRAMDHHAFTAPMSSNMPVIMALLGVWHQNFLDASSRLVVPYSNFLDAFPSYLQQLFMESQGKSVTQFGEHIDFATGAVIWGQCGTNSQHSFHQLLMQGTHLIPVDFILPKKSVDGTINQELMAHALAQSQVLMEGLHDVDSHHTIAGNVPSNMLLMECLDAYHLGALVALYEHIVYIQSVIWGINAFDQWGVQRGKMIANTLLRDLSQQSVTQDYDSSTQALLKQLAPN